MATLIFHTGALGDSVLIWPLLRALGPVTLVCPWSKAMLAQRWLPGVRAVDGDSPEFARLFVPSGDCEAGDGVRKLLGNADRIISFISDGRDAWARNVRAMCPGKVVCVPFSVPPRAEAERREATPFDASRQPAATRGGSETAIPFFHQRLLAQQGVAYEPVLAERRINRDGPVIIHPGGGGREKCWAPARFDALIEHLNHIGRPLQSLLGEVERERLDPIWPEKWARECEVIQPPDLIDLSLVISRASVFVGNDSGPTHLAAALGVPTIALFGPTDPRIWSPIGPAVVVLAPPEPRAMDWLEVELVAEAIARR